MKKLFLLLVSLPSLCFATITEEQIYRQKLSHPEFDKFQVEVKLVDLGNNPDGTFISGTTYRNIYNDGHWIALNPNMPFEFLRHIFIHEHMHVFWNTKLSPKQKDDWCSAFLLYKRSPTMYGKKSCDENFAEYASYFYYQSIENQFYTDLLDDHFPQIKMLTEWRNLLFNERNESPPLPVIKKPIVRKKLNTPLVKNQSIKSAQEQVLSIWNNIWRTVEKHPIQEQPLIEPPRVIYNAKQTPQERQWARRSRVIPDTRDRKSNTPDYRKMLKQRQARRRK